MTKPSKAHLRRVIAMFGKLDIASSPFPPLKVPPLREYEKDKWQLRRARGPGHPKVVRGYFSGLQPLMSNWLLVERCFSLERGEHERVWMSITPMELESQAHHALAAHGRVLIGGGGMGVVAWNCAIKPEVEKVVIVERDMEIMMLCNHIAYTMQWPAWREKVRWVNEDILSFKPRGEGYDVALIDIWPGLGDPHIRPDMQAIHSNVKAKRYAAWGMELDYITWCQDNDVPLNAAEHDPQVWNKYSASIGVPLIMENEPKMGNYAVQAGLQYIRMCEERSGDALLKSIAKEAV